MANPPARSILIVIGATADRGGHVIIGVGFAPCGNSETDLFASGGGINFIVRLDIKSRACSGSCMATFTMKGWPPARAGSARNGGRKNHARCA